MRQMMRSLAHRGPDDEGLYRSGSVILGHRRLSIVDPEGGAQPLRNEDRSIWISANGEIYNHPSLRDRLAARGHGYATASDSETIVHLYEEHGSDVFRELRGMFAVALWDDARRRLLLGRDRLGIKPLYYAVLEDGTLVFGSEIKAILASGFVRAELNEQTLPELFTNRFVAGRSTLFRGVEELPPGHRLIWEDGRIRVERYWDLGESLRVDRENGDRTDEFRETLTEAVASHLMSDVPVGVLLSGGLDSTTIAALMARRHSDVASFSVGYRGEAESELPYAEIAARHLGTEHHSVDIGPEEFFEAVPDLVWHQDSPLPWPSCVPLYFVCRRAGEHVKVVLTGEGADELLGGYGRYGWTLWNDRWARRFRRLPRSVRHVSRKVAAGAADHVPAAGKLYRTFLLRSHDVRSLYFDNFGVFEERVMPGLFSDRLRDRLTEQDADPYAYHHRRWAESADAGLLSRLLHVDCMTYLGELLMKQDRMSMAASIESRVPFLDNRMIDLAFRLPDEDKMERREGKQILRRAVRDLVPDAVLDRPKAGFPTPVGRWMARDVWDCVADHVLAGDRATADLFDTDTVEEIAHAHRDGRSDHTERLWMLFNLEQWARTFDVAIDL